MTDEYIQPVPQSWPPLREPESKIEPIGHLLMRGIAEPEELQWPPSLVDDEVAGAETMPCVSQPCPQFQEIDLTVTASAPVGHEPIEGVRLEEHVQPVEECPVCRVMEVPPRWI